MSIPVANVSLHVTGLQRLYIVCSGQSDVSACCAGARIAGKAKITKAGAVSKDSAGGGPGGHDRKTETDKAYDCCAVRARGGVVYVCCDGCGHHWYAAGTGGWVGVMTLTYTVNCDVMPCLCAW